MKFSPTMTLALALAAGVAGAAAAQTMTAPGSMSPESQPGAAQAQPRATYGQGQPSWQAQPNMQTPSGMPAQPRQGARARPDAQAGSDQTMEPSTARSMTQPGATQSLTQPGAGQPATQPGARQSMLPDAAQAPLGIQKSDQIRQAQERLSALGLYKGPIDGQMDPDTRAAIANFQQQNGIGRTADLDQRTLDRLMAGQTTGSGSSMPATALGPAPGAGAAPTGAGENSAGPAVGR